MGNVIAYKTLSQKSWKKYLKMIAKSNEAILLIDEKIQFSYFNKKAAKILKIKNRRGVKLTPALISPLKQPHLGVDSVSGSQSVVENVYKSQDGRFDYVWQHQRVTGELFFVRVYLTIIRVKNKTHCQCLWRPIKNPNEIFTSSISSMGSFSTFNSLGGGNSLRSFGSMGSFNTLDSTVSNTSFASLKSTNSDISLNSFEKQFQDLNLGSKSSNGQPTTNNLSSDNYSLSTQSLHSKTLDHSKGNLDDIQPTTSTKALKNKRNKNRSISRKKKNPFLPIYALEIDKLDIDENFLDFQANIKKIVRSTNDLIAEKKVIEEFHKFEKTFNMSLKKRENYIQKLTLLNKKSKRNSRKNYKRLEHRLQERLFLYNEEVKKTKEIEEENKMLKRSFQQLQKTIDYQKNQFDKFIKILDENKSEND
ncbi:hypothetical protein M0813_09679 [Anaeramoeba flamelloides]|uniref:Uncharacterized protein n=1 Tax=Anaeramoeba flamelloides TaxID=1746091 RepID=A0ABQ8X5U1_9EUKA|nr:hypothetical protein M0813_09679 [Anaeramoeba flamelloides]